MIAALTLTECRELRNRRVPIWCVGFLAFIGTPLDDGTTGTTEHFYPDEASATAAHDAICTSGDAETCELAVWRPCAPDAGRRGYVLAPLESWEAPPAKPVAVIDGVTWWGTAADGFDGEARGYTTVASVRRCEAGEADGGLVALARLLAASHGLTQPEQSPAGWYWSATAAEGPRRGVWSRPNRAESLAAAFDAASAYATAHDREVAA
jgi:hypothetical protein